MPWNDQISDKPGGFLSELEGMRKKELMTPFSMISGPALLIWALLEAGFDDFVSSEMLH